MVAKMSAVDRSRKRTLAATGTKSLRADKPDLCRGRKNFGSFFIAQRWLPCAGRKYFDVPVTGDNGKSENRDLNNSLHASRRGSYAAATPH